MKRFITLTKALMLQTLRNPQTLFWNLVFPVFLLGIYRIVFANEKVSGVDYLRWVVPGVIALNIMSFGLVGSSANILDMREKGVLRRLRATPLPPLQLVGANLVNFLALALLQCAAIVIAAWLLFGVAYPPANLLLALPFVLLSILAFVALGQVISGTAQKMGVALAIGQMVYFLQMFIGDMIIPLAQLPAWLQPIVKLLPSYAMGALIRPAFLEGATDSRFMTNIIVLLGYAVIGALIAAKTFRWDPKA
jgi:ABC-2 type transport system permease protein